MLSVEQKEFLDREPGQGPIRLFIQSSTVPGAVARVELSNGTYTDAMQALEWVNSRGAHESVASLVRTDEEPVELKWDLKSQDAQGTLWLHLESLDDFQKAVSSITSFGSMDRLALSICEEKMR